MELPVTLSPTNSTFLVFLESVFSCLLDVKKIEVARPLLSSNSAFVYIPYLDKLCYLCMLVNIQGHTEQD